MTQPPLRLLVKEKKKRHKEGWASVVPQLARCFPLPACSLMAEASCCSCLLRPSFVWLYCWPHTPRWFMGRTREDLLEWQPLAYLHAPPVWVCVCVFSIVSRLRSHWSRSSGSLMGEWYTLYLHLLWLSLSKPPSAEKKRSMVHRLSSSVEVSVWRAAAPQAWNA